MTPANHMHIVNHDRGATSLLDNVGRLVRHICPGDSPDSIYVATVTHSMMMLLLLVQT